MPKVEVGTTPNITPAEAAAARAALAVDSQPAAGRMPVARLPLGPMGYRNHMGGGACIVWDDNVYGLSEDSLQSAIAKAYRDAFHAKGVPCCLAINSYTLENNTAGGKAFYLDCQNTYGFEALNHGRSHDHILDLTDAQQDAIVNGGLDDLLAMGFDVKHFCYTFGEHDSRLRKLVAQRHGSACVVSQGRILNRPPVNTFSLGRVGLGNGYSSTTLAVAQAYALAAKNTNSLVIYMLHPHLEVSGGTHDTATLTLLTSLLTFLADNQIPVLTMSQAMERFGNIQEAGDFASYHEQFAPNGSYTASISGNNMTVTGVTSGKVVVGQSISGAGVTSATITSQTSSTEDGGALNGKGVYVISGGAQTVSPAVSITGSGAASVKTRLASGSAVGCDGKLVALEQSRIIQGISALELDKERDYQRLGRRLPFNIASGIMGRIYWETNATTTTLVNQSVLVNGDGARGSCLALFHSASTSASALMFLAGPNYFVNNGSGSPSGVAYTPANLWARWRGAAFGGMAPSNSKRKVFLGIGTAAAFTTGSKFGVLIDDESDLHAGKIKYFMRQSRATAASCSMSGTTLTVGGAITGVFAVGQTITGSGIPANSRIAAFGTGTGGAGDYTLTQSATVAGPVAIVGWEDTVADSGLSSANDTEFCRDPWTVNLAVDAGVGRLKIWRGYDLVFDQAGIVMNTSLILSPVAMAGRFDTDSLTYYLHLRDVEWGFMTDPW